jgi:ankyrin repeat protein
MRPISKETMKMRHPNIENISGTYFDKENKTERKSSHAIFLYDDLDQERKTKIDELIDYFSKDRLKLSKLGCAPFGNGSANEKKLRFLDVLGEKIKSGEIGSDTIIFMNFHTHSEDDKFSFCIKGIDEKMRIPVEEVYQYVWSFFTEDEKPSFHNLGCNAGYYAKNLQDGDGHVINYAGQSTISSNENIIQAKEVLRFVSICSNFDSRMPNPEKIWRHMESYATQEMSFAGKGNYMAHQPMELPSSTINGRFDPKKGHKNPKLLIEYAFRHRPMKQVLELIQIHDPKHKKISAFDEKTKKRILFHIIPNRVHWDSFNEYAANTPFMEKFLDDTDSLQKVLFCFEHNLLPKSIDKHQANKFLIFCCEAGNAKLAKLVLGMREFPVSNFGVKNAFLESVRLGNIELVTMLFDRLTDFHIKTTTLDTVFHFACSHPDSEIVKLLLAPKSLCKFFGDSLIERREARTSLLNDKNIYDVLPLELAIRKNNPETVELLLEAGANPEIPNSKGNNLFYQAFFYRNAAIVKLLLERGFETSIKNGDFSLVLRQAILKSEREIALILIRQCKTTGTTSELNIQYTSGFTPLSLAAKKKDVKLVAALLDAGADPTTFDHLGKNVLHRMAKEPQISHEKSNSITRNTITTSSEQLINQEFNFSQTEEIVKTLILKGAALNGSDKAGNTPLITATKEKNTTLVQILLSQGANINAMNKKGYTALHYALKKQDKNLSKYFLEKGIDLDATNFNLDAALSLAEQSNDMLALKYINAAIDKKNARND